MIKKKLAVALSIALLSIGPVEAAKYRVVELDVANVGEDSFPSAINDDGEMSVNVASPYNVPIDLDLLDFDSIALNALLTDPAAASFGNINEVDYELLLGFIRDQSGSQLSQQIASLISYQASEDETNYIPVFDQEASEDGDYTFSSNVTTRDINNSDFTAGSSQGYYFKVDYQLDDGEDVTFVVNEFGRRGFVSRNGVTTELPPPEDFAGGFSEAYGLNNSNQVVGFGTTEFLTDSFELAEENCEDEDLRGDVPYESCISSLAATLTSNLTDASQLRGLIWELDDEGNLLDTTELGILFEPEAEDTSGYTSRAVAINDNGIAVGVSNGEYTNAQGTVIRNYGVIFNGDEIINLTPNPEELVALSTVNISTATDINNNNLVVGYHAQRVNGFTRDKFFVYDMSLGELESPDDFFAGSRSVALAVNNNNLVVGFGEVDAAINGRRSEGFLYDHNTQEFNRIGDLIDCDSIYTIVQANAINDNDEIAATALYLQPARDSRGELILDSGGNEILVDKIAAVKLVPIEGGEIETCEVPIEEIARPRQGASLGWLIMFSGLLLLWRRVVKR
ncbi:DUF3466 family protein [Paraglaciecola sp. 2405UD69-4]|uniref:DUF3466 family protein n=1 Tax=Paraglaciecola sp. 2405UD69-4 TaxID=3391836 RepID=UPI0039C8F53D